MSSQTIRQRSGIEQYQTIQRTRRSDFRAAANARGFTSAPPAAPIENETSAALAWAFVIAVMVGFVILVSQIISLGETHQRIRDAQHRSEAQGLTAIAVNHGGRDEIVCVGGAR